MNKFKRGDVVVNKSGEYAIVDLVPGMEAYDAFNFGNAEFGFIPKDGDWEYKSDWVLVPETKDESFVFGVEEFNKIIEKIKETHNIKNHDYAGDKYISNLTASERLGMPAWKGGLVRIQDKVSRLENFAKQDVLKVKDESIEDTLLDLAVYAILDLILYRKDKNDRNKI